MDSVFKIVPLEFHKFPRKLFDVIKNVLCHRPNKKTMFIIVVAFLVLRYRANKAKKKIIIPSDGVDWHDWEFIEHEKERIGIGEHGEAAYLENYPPMSDLMNKSQGYNGYLSDQISLNRALKDLRPRTCIEETYSPKLPKVSVIIPFHDEQLSTLLRTCYSVWLRSPDSLLDEIILVDDASTIEALGDYLTEYVEKHLPIVKIIRLKERSGLIKARMIGAEEAKSEVLLFLDAHIEVYNNWLPPLLDAMVDDYRTVVIPTIDLISSDTFEYKRQFFPHIYAGRGMIDLNFNYKVLALFLSDIQKSSKPFETPVMSAGMFAINADFFWELRGFDLGLETYGGEQYDMSFKIWQCGGRLVETAFSRVGHIYRSDRAAVYSHLEYDFIGTNYKRIAETWMDEFKDYVYKVNPSRFTKLNVTDISAQMALRERIECKSFRWYLENVAFDWIRKLRKAHPEILWNFQL